jgi:hypothetical protein
MQKYPTQCLVCEKEVEFDSHGDDGKGVLPNPVGGTIDIDFGYPSRFDDINIYPREPVIHQAIICDDCYEKKQHLTRPVVKRQYWSWEILPQNYRNK